MASASGTADDQLKRGLQRSNTLHRASHYVPHSSDIQRIPQFNKGSAFTTEERAELHLRGLLPVRVQTLSEQVARSLAQLRRYSDPLNKYIYLESLRTRSETLFFAVLIGNLVETMPIVYTPTVGEACIEYAHIWRNGSGMYFTKSDRSHFRRMLDNWRAPSVDIIVVTDGSRILGLGDLGINGMGIPIGKLSLYVAGSGFHPQATLPVCLDTGCNTASIRDDPHYLGTAEKRLPDEEFYPLVEEFMSAVVDKWPHVLVQFEDFSNDHCFELLEKYRHRQLCFNDDIQGTGAVVLSGYINAVKTSGIALADHRIVFHGAGSAGTGVADMIAMHVSDVLKISIEQARQQFYFVDTKGLITADRGDTLASHKIPFARKDNAGTQCGSLLDTIKFIRPTCLIGLSGDPGAFTKEMVELVTGNTPRPLIFALSNPTSKAECTAEQAYHWSGGKAIFASGSPFAPVTIDGKTYTPGQGNNMYIFPGLGRGAQLCQAKEVTDKMILTAARTLADYVSEEELASGLIYPKLADIRAISVSIAVEVIKAAQSEDMARHPNLPTDLHGFVQSQLYVPSYI